MWANIIRIVLIPRGIKNYLNSVDSERVEHFIFCR